MKATQTFSEWAHGAAEAEKARGVLSKKFHEGLISLLNENPGKSNKELAKLFNEVIVEVCNKELGGTAKEKIPSWGQMISDYKRGLELCGYDLLKTTGWSQLKEKKAAVAAALKEKAAGGVSDDSKGATDDGGGKGASGNGGASDTGTQFAGSPVADKLRELESLLTHMSEGQALDFVNKTIAIANTRLGQGNKRTMVAGARQ